MEQLDPNLYFCPFYYKSAVPPTEAHIMMTYWHYINALDTQKNLTPERLSDTIYDQVNNLLGKYLNQEDIEIELRFNEINSKKGGISAATFQRIHNYFGNAISSGIVDEQGNPFTPIQIERTLDVVLQNQAKSKVRQTFFLPLHGLDRNNMAILPETTSLSDELATAESIFAEKTKLQGLDSEYGYRFGVAREKIINNLPLQQYKPTFYRLKLRYIVNLNKHFRLDLTEVRMGNNLEALYSSQSTYEVELELVNLAELQNDGYIMDELYRMIHIFLQLVNQTIEPYTVKDYAEITKLMNDYVFRAPQVIPLTKDTFHNIFNGEYSVTAKADGTRYFMVTIADADQTRIYFLGTNGHLIKTNMLSKTPYNIFDGELLIKPINNRMLLEYFPYDAIVCTGKQGQSENLTKYNHIDRVKRTYDFIGNLEQMDTVKILPKRFYDGTILESSLDILNQYPMMEQNDGVFAPMQYWTWQERFSKYTLPQLQRLGIYSVINDAPFAIDGLVYTNIKSHYTEVPFSYKWKESEDTTIDFKIVKIVARGKPGYPASAGANETDETWELYTHERLPDPKNPKRTIVNDLLFTTLVLDKNRWHTEKFNTETVVEFRYDYDMNQFVPVRSRPDKRNGNIVTVVESNLLYLENPIPRSVVSGLNRTRIERLKNFERLQFYNINGHIKPKNMIYDFHSWIKRNLFTNYAHDTDLLLDIGSGKGGDFRKWWQAGIKHVIGMDINPIHISEANSRFQTVLKTEKNQSFPRVKYYQADLRKDNIQRVTGLNRPVTVISAQFSFHYFFETDASLNNMLQNIKDNLAVGGYFIGTTFDGRSVFDLLRNYKKGQTFDWSYGGKNLFSIQKLYDNVTDFDVLPLTGQRISVNLSASILEDESVSKQKAGVDEFLINFDKFVALLADHGLQLIETAMFEDMYMGWNLKKETYIIGPDKVFSFLNRAFVFRRISDTTGQLPSVPEPVIIQTPKTVIPEPTPKTVIPKPTPKTIIQRPTPKTVIQRPTPKTVIQRPTSTTVKPIVIQKAEPVTTQPTSELSWADRMDRDEATTTVKKTVIKRITNLPVKKITKPVPSKEEESEESDDGSDDGSEESDDGSDDGSEGSDDESDDESKGSDDESDDESEGSDDEKGERVEVDGRELPKWLRQRLNKNEPNIVKKALKNAKLEPLDVDDYVMNDDFGAVKERRVIYYVYNAIDNTSTSDIALADTYEDESEAILATYMKRTGKKKDVARKDLVDSHLNNTALWKLLSRRYKLNLFIIDYNERSILCTKLAMRDSIVLILKDDQFYVVGKKSTDQWIIPVMDPLIRGLVNLQTDCNDLLNNTDIE